MGGPPQHVNPADGIEPRDGSHIAFPAIILELRSNVKGAATTCSACRSAPPMSCTSRGAADTACDLVAVRLTAAVSGTPAAASKVSRAIAITYRGGNNAAVAVSAVNTTGVGPIQ